MLLRVYLDCFAVISDGAISIAASLIDDTAADISVGEFRANFYRLCVIGNRPVAVAFMQHDNAAIVVGLSILRTDLDSFVVIRNRQVMVAFGLERAPAV